MRVFLLTGILLALTASTQAADAPPSLSGSWTGTWTDTRSAYNGSGGNFTGEFKVSGPAAWTGTFALGKSKTFVVELKGKIDKDTLVIDTAVDLGAAHGSYTIKGFATSDTLTATYEGPGEKGLFTMKRVSK